MRSGCVRLSAWCAAAILVVSATGVGCTARGRVTAATPEPVAPPSTREVESLIEQGCFRCLERALAEAERRGFSQLAFEAAALLALRATELGMPAGEWVDRARTIAGDDAERVRHLEMVAAVPPDPLSGLRDDLLVETRARNQTRSLLPSWYEVLASGQASVAFRQYLELTLTCSVDSSPERADRLAGLADAIPRIPLLEYRVGICSDQHAARLAAVHAAMPEFVDAHFVLGRYALRSREAPDPDEALRRFRAAAESFPSSTAIPMSIGNLYQSWEAWADALTSYDHVLSVAPTHPDAQLGRLISLSHLERHDEAIAAAAGLIDGGRWHLGQAFYWRAWNHFSTGSNHSARLDADRTRTLMVNAPVFVLSGMIEWRFRRLESAEKEFQEAITMDFGQCDAAFYLGGVRSELRKLPEAIAAMNQARQCYELSIAVRRKATEAVLAGRGTAQHKARESARQERAIAAVVKRRDEALKAIEALSAYDNRQR